MSRDNLYGDWERRLREQAGPVRWGKVAAVVLRGVLIGLAVVAVTGWIS